MASRSTIIACISSALNDLQLLESACSNSPTMMDDEDQEILKSKLASLRTFLLCARNWSKKNELVEKKHDTASLQALVVRIRDTISKRTQEIPSSDELLDVVNCFEEDKESFRQEICQYNDVFLDFSSQHSSDSVARKDDLMEFMDSLLETLRYSEALGEKLAFLKTFIRFVSLHGVEDLQLGPLLIHTEAVAIQAAGLSYRCWFQEDDDEETISELVLKIIPVEPRVRETCVEALIASRLSRKSLRETDEHILKDFVDSLKCNFEDILQSGHVILSLSLNAIKGYVDLVSSDLGEEIQLIETILAPTCPESSSFDFPKTNGLGFVDFLLVHMTDLTSSEAGSIALVNHPIETVMEELTFLRSFLDKIVELKNEDRELQAIWDRVVGVAYRIEFVIDFLMVGAVLDSSSMSFHPILEDIKNIKAEVLNISDSERLSGKAKEATKSANPMPTQGSKAMINDVVVGLEDEAAWLINRLKRGSNQVQIISIVGMPGLGKTTLARKVYNDSSVKLYFHQRAWCTVSQAYHLKNLLLQILTCIESSLPNDIFEMKEEDLALQVKKRLLRNRYLIVLDDMWDIKAWTGLEASFPDNGNGSRVILTSRHRDVAPEDKLDQEPHSPRELTPDQSWDLLKAKLGKELPPPELFELRQQIVDICQGLPLTIVILAGILSSMKQYGWKEVVEGLSLRNVSSTEQCKATLELSHKNLPDNLKACFLYFGAFPEDHEHNTWRLISLWIAEGFAKKKLS